MITIDTRKFQRIKQRIIADIKAGILQPGAQIESESELMARYGVARMTVVRSLNEMVSEGYLVRIRGKGTFVRTHSQNGDNRGLAAFALVLPEVRDGFYPSLIKSFGDASAQLNHQILTCDTNNDVGRQGNAILQLIDNHVAGVALLPTSIGEPPVYHIRQLQQNRIPVVQLHRGVLGVSAPLIALEFDEVARFAGRALLAAGHRRIAYFTTHASIPTRAYAAALGSLLNEVGSELPDSLVHYGKRWGAHQFSEHEASVEGALHRMLALPKGERPTAIFSTWDDDAELIYLSLQKMGVRIPEDVSMIGFGGAWRSSAIIRRLTSIVADEGYAGRAAVELLDAMAAGRQAMDEQVRLTIPLSLYAGETIAQCSS